MISSGQKPSYYPSLTGLRALAALMVFIHHLAQIQSFPNWARYFAEGYLGVSVFFTLSGFLIARTYYASFRDGTISMGTYLRRRFARVYPVIFVLLTARLLLDEQMVWNWPSLLADYTLTQGYFALYRWSGLAPAWSLSTEETFYLIIPACFWLLARARGRALDPWRTGGILGLLALGGWILGKLVPSLSAAVGNPGYFLYTHSDAIIYSLCGRFTEFAVGIFAGLHFRESSPDAAVRPGRANLAFFGGLGLIALAHVFLRWIEVSSGAMWGIFAANGYYGLWLTSAGTAMVIWSCVQRGSWPTRILGNRWVEYGGRISFSFYLLQEHFYLLKLRGGVMDFFGFDADTILEFNPLLALAMLAAMIVAATLVYELVEKPAHRWLKGNEAPRRDPAAAPPAPPAAAA